MIGRFSLLKSTSASCFGESILNSHPGLLVNLRAELFDALAKDGALLFEHCRVDGDAVGFHFDQHVDQGRFEIVVEFSQGGDFVELFVEPIRQPECDVGILGGVTRDARQLHPIHRDLRSALADQFIGGDFFEVQQIVGEADRCRRPSALHRAGTRRSSNQATTPFTSMPACAHDDQVVLDVVADLLNLRIFENWLQGGEHFVAFECFASGGAFDGHIKALPVFPTEAHADQFGAALRSSAVVSVSKAKRFCCFSSLKELLERFIGVDQTVVACHRRCRVRGLGRRARSLDVGNVGEQSLVEPFRQCGFWSPR